jgi:hypothetical protein
VKTLLYAQDLIEAQLIKNLLQSEGIESMILGEFLQGAIGELPASGLIRVNVEDDIYEQALRLVEDYFNSSPVE